MKNSIPCIYIIILIFVVSHCGQKEHSVEIRNIENVKFIKNPDYPKLKNETFIYDEILSIGLEEGDEAYVFSIIKDIKVDNKEHIYILDSKNFRIQVFDSEGKFIRTIGNKGQGPGEFLDPQSIDLDGKNNLYISEYFPGKITCFDENGKFNHNIYMKKDYVSPVIAGFYYRYDFIYMVVLKFRDKLKPTEYPVFYEMIKVDTNGSFLKAIESFEAIKSQNYNKLNITLDCEYHSAWTVDRIGNIYIGFNNKYEIRIYGIHGNLKMKILRDCKPEKITKQDKEESLKDISEQKKSHVKFPKYRPFFEKIITDDDGNLWVQRFGKDKNGKHEFDIFNSDGIYNRKIKLAFIPKYFQNGYVYAITETENGFPSIKKFKLKK